VGLIMCIYKSTCIVTKIIFGKEYYIFYNTNNKFSIIVLFNNKKYNIFTMFCLLDYMIACYRFIGFLFVRLHDCIMI